MKNKIIYSSEFKLINDYLSSNVKLYKKINVDSNLDLKESLYFLINEISQKSLFLSNEPIVVFLDNLPSKKVEKNEIELFMDISKIKREIIICIVTDTLKVVDQLKEYFEIINIPKLTYWSMSSIIEKKLKENSIQYDQNSLSLLKSKLIPDPWIIENEIKKIVLNTNKLSSKFINDNINDYNNNSQYKIIENFFKKNYNKALSIFEEIYSEKRNIDEIMAIFISYVFNLRTIMLFWSKNPNKSLIEEFKIQQFQETQFISIIKNTTIDNIDNLLNILIELDKGIKNGTKDPYNSFKLLISGGYHG